jgi:hypothetical protein
MPRADTRAKTATRLSPGKRIASLLRNFITFSGRFLTHSLEKFASFANVSARSALTKELFRTQSRDFFGNSQIKKLIEWYSFALGCLACLFSQRGR